MASSWFSLHSTLEEFICRSPDDDAAADDDDDDDDDDNGIIAAKMAPFSCSSLPATPEFSPDHRCGILQAFFTSRLS